ncbi:polyribonucleotide nucleotidyltransferase [Halobacteriovorax marinus]|uniref:polyribonucleotide nucleotidyltransferase n=1 Tax=Halobacteriovorax marinus TaxID=97084 RepID=UPI000BC31AF0|nr:polyribonucleotide nucleotidyltransferase [Halobacteriovorax marinus]ATH07721.1 polyribonucleotide nucleotidyltransferase [Halobacteriovorax marinus]
MLNDKKVYSLNYGGKEVTVETGRLAKQADGSVLVSCNGTQVLVTVCSAHEVKDGQDFFPLLVEYTEKFYSAGKFVGGFLKREGRPSTSETLNARLIDRPLRPLFPEGYMFDTVVSCNVLSYSDEGDAEVLAGLGASAALTISDIPFNGPIGTCKVGRVDGKLVLNPSHSQWAESDLEIAVAASADAILMVEGEAKIVPEKEVLEAIYFGHDNIKEYVKLMEQMRSEIGRPKREFVSAAANETMMSKMRSDFASGARNCISIDDKMDRQRAVKALEKEVKNAMSEAPEAFGLTADDSFGKEAYKGVDELLYEMMRGDILNEEKRIAGRGMTEVREIETEANLLEHVHGSSLFTRGETQVMAAVTIGGKHGEKMEDSIRGTEFQKFYLHYNFPPFSVGEARGVRGVGRRELGHGNLAERAVKAVMPSEEEFAYTTRIVCEVMESNGSSSMGSVCSASMALMDAGVPISNPVAGIAMGLITDGERFKVLTDILGDEDHLGDMDFKVAGTADGITAIQMDIKITGLTREIVEKSIEQAREGRLHILGEMAKTISTKRAEFKDGVPRIVTVQIPVDKIGALIGPGGKNIKKLQEDFDVTVEITEEGLVKVLGTDTDILNNCVASIDLQINGPEVGSIYEAVVVTIKEYGAFVDIIPGVSGLVHVSELSDERVKDVSEYLSEGDKVSVKVVEVDRMGRLKLSAKAVKPVEKKADK